MPDTEQPPQTSATVQQIQLLVRRNRVLWRWLMVAEGVGLTVAAVLAYFLLALLLDNVLHLPVAGRLFAGAGLLVCVIGLGSRLLRRWRARQLSEDEIALAVERNTPGGVQNRLINALQISRDDGGGGQAYRALVVEDNWQELQQLHLEHARRLRPALIRLGAALAVIAAGCTFWLLSPGGFSNAARRILLPFAAIDPLYDTVLTVAPGDTTAEEDLTITISIAGEIPDHLTVLQSAGGQRTTIHIAVPPAQSIVTYTFRHIDRSFDYAVQGGDYTSRFYRVEVPQPARLQQLTASCTYPAYTGRPPEVVTTGAGNLELLRGTRMTLRFAFDHQPTAAALIIEPGARRLVLDEALSCPFTLAETVECVLETRVAEQPPRTGSSFVWRALADQPPSLELSGLERQTETAIDVSLPISLVATDDYGLQQVGLFRRRIRASASPPSAAEDWTPIEIWPADGLPLWRHQTALSMLALGAAEGDRFQVVTRATDLDPEKGGEWASGTIYSVLVGGAGVALQLLYEQILRTETELERLVHDQQQAIGAASEWLAKFRQNSGVRWDDAETLTAFSAAMTAQAQAQSALRETGSRTAREMVSEAGSLRLSLGMLADTELVRAARILETVAERETPQDKQSALADARQTQERTTDSLLELAAQYRRFRQSWELTHMIRFLEMLAERQASLAAESARHAAASDTAPADAAELQQASASRRQGKVDTLLGLSRVAFSGLISYTAELEPILSAAFGGAAAALAEPSLTTPLQQAIEQLRAGQWQTCAPLQTLVAERLAAIHEDLRAAQKEAARLAQDQLAELLKSEVAGQTDIDSLLAGDLQSLLDKADEDLELAEIIRMHKLADEARKRHELDRDDNTVDDYSWDDSMAGLLHGGRPQKPDFSVLSLADKPGGQRSFPDSSDLPGNKMELALLEGEFQDLVGDLLEEADDVRDEFETYNLNAQGQGVEEGNIGKQAGDINSVSAAAATGNMKPPSQNFGGASRIGRQGARAHGMVIGNESVDRRGRDEAQEGQEQAPDQAGMLKEVASDDPQQDSSTGIGGKQVDSDDTMFSLKDSGKFTDEVLKRLGKAQATHKIVERQDGGIAADVAELMKDFTSQQEQIIQRLKALRKELRNLYLPTDHIDGLLAQLSANLDAFKTAPDADVFRRQLQTLDQLRSALRVFRSASAGYEPSIPREQVVRGRVLDEPSRRPLPGYDQAVKDYYQLLSTE